ncbi:hypothetical protein SEA_YOSIF_55 [Streptomyces phage Yosif]|uniref:Uncharacterized protein n=1 Tax=Streptomyces phage Yosif TaxID=2201421 RepID=A0A2Z4QBV0_9CAUD|nr:hypothetical protein KGG71_gp55 [Streptomyces phage Yosif]AWY07619.1 hypothetical protein SEA_YOSIF_55 [Streptomyces phage Yosif]
MTRPILTRPEQILERYPKLFESERLDKLPVWARAVITDLRMLLLREATENDYLREDISRLLERERAE